MTDLLKRAAAYENLAPYERALLRLVEGLLAAGLVAALPLVAMALSQHHAVDWGSVLDAFVAGAATALLLALSKWTKAHSDPVLPTPLEPAPRMSQHTTQEVPAA